MKNPSWKLLGVAVWGVLWLLLAISFVVPGLGDNPAYDRLRYIAGGVFVILTLIGFAYHAWTTHPDALPLPFLRGKARPVSKPSTGPAAPAASTGTAPARKKTGADLPTVLRDRPKTGGSPAPLKKPVTSTDASTAANAPAAPVSAPSNNT